MLSLVAGNWQYVVSIENEPTYTCGLLGQNLSTKTGLAVVLVNMVSLRSVTHVDKQPRNTQTYTQTNPISSATYAQYFNPIQSVATKLLHSFHIAYKRLKQIKERNY